MALDGDIGGGNRSGTGVPPAPDVMTALSADQVQVQFLPTVDLRTARVVGAEALVHWAHPARGLLPPSKFLPHAARAGEMRPLTERVIELSARAAGDWWGSGLGLQLSVDLPSTAFAEPDWQLDEFLGRTLKRTGLPATALRLEISDQALTIESVRERLERVTDLGASISVKGFGTGRFSIRELADLPIQELKIDRSLILELGDRANATVVRSTIHLAHHLGLQVVAEGVETEDAWRKLRSMGAQRAQGSLISEPLPARELPAWLAAWNQRARGLRSARRVQRRAKAAAKHALTGR